MIPAFRIMALATKEIIRKEGRVLEALPNAAFRVLLDDGKEALGHLSGKMRMHYIKVLVGDKVIIEFSRYDETRGRVVKRL